VNTTNPNITGVDVAAAVVELLKMACFIIFLPIKLYKTTNTQKLHNTIMMRTWLK
jgi:hypothetical protein